MDFQIDGFQKEKNNNKKPTNSNIIRGFTQASN